MPSSLLQIFITIVFILAYYGIPTILVAMFIRILARMFLRVDERNTFIRFLARITDPFIEPFRRFQGAVTFFDLSYLIAFFLLITLQVLILQSIPARL